MPDCPACASLRAEVSRERSRVTRLRDCLARFLAQLKDLEVRGG